MLATHRHEHLLNFAVHVGELMLKNGAETYRVEDTMTRILQVNHFKTIEPFVTPTGIIVTINDDYFPTCTKVVRVKNRTSRLDRIEQLNQLSRDFVSGHISLREAFIILKHIEKLQTYRTSTIILWLGISCGFFSIMFGGKLLDFFLSILIGIGLGLLKNNLDERRIVSFFVLFLCALYIGFMADFLEALLSTLINKESIIIACIMPLLPGVSFTTAIRDAIGDELISGISRGVEALLVAVALAVGIGAALGAKIWIGGLLS